jgi:hypothetical protein
MTNGNLSHIFRILNVVISNDNGVRLVNFATSNVVILSFYITSSVQIS